MDNEERIARAAQITKIVRRPKQSLATFGSSKLHYYVVTDPVFKEWSGDQVESVIRKGLVVSNRPQLVTPTYMLNLDGFSEDAYTYMEEIAQRLGPNSPGILYGYKNNPETMDIVSGNPFDVAYRIATELDAKSRDNAVVITGLDELWDVSLMKFIYEYTLSSANSNAREMRSMGLLDTVPDLGVPSGIVQRIEELFKKTEKGSDPNILHRELKRWGLFDVYETRFYRLFRK